MRSAPDRSPQCRSARRARRDHRHGAEQAIAKLQTALTKYPKAEEFADTEAMLKGILDGRVRAPACENPR
jgi:outer membrane protein assembly factor BamD (BamD/ComL family)